MQEIVKTDNLEWLRSRETNSVDFGVIDPPYALGKIKSVNKLVNAWLAGEDGFEFQSKGFMGKQWDMLPPPAFWAELLRVIKPGGYVAIFAGSRTLGMMDLSLRLAGWEIRDLSSWLYASGFPHGHNISAEIDRILGVESQREVVGHTEGKLGWTKYSKKHGHRPYRKGVPSQGGVPITAPVSDLAALFADFSTALKPSYEPIILAQKPLSERTLARNVLKWGTGMLNIGACRIPTQEDLGRLNPNDSSTWGTIGNGPGKQYGKPLEQQQRYPSNVVLSHALWCDIAGGVCYPSCPVAELDRQSGVERAPAGGQKHLSRKRSGFKLSGSADNVQTANAPDSYGDGGGASRYYPQFAYTEDDIYFMWKFLPKASTGERNEGLSGLKRHKKVYNGVSQNSGNMRGVEARFTSEMENVHPTVKPEAIVSWLMQLVAPPVINGKRPIGIDTHAGSGTALLAAYALDIDFIGLEKEANYVEIATHRLAARKRQLRFNEYMRELELEKVGS